MNQKPQAPEPSAEALARHQRVLADAQKTIRQIFAKPQPYQQKPATAKEGRE